MRGDSPTPQRVRRSTAGQDELTHRSRGLGQRHRTLLLLANGERDRDTLLAMAAAAGVEARFFDELLAGGLLELDAAPAATPVIEAPETASATADRAPLDVPTATPPPPPPSSRRPPPLERARTLLIDALKQYAPVAGSLLARRIRKAETAAEIEALLDEAEARMARSGTLVQAAQVVRRARELLARCA